MITVVIVLIILLICIVESAFCFLMKRHETPNFFTEEKKTEETDRSEKQKFSLVGIVLAIANDFTFLFTKVVGYIPSHFIRKFFYRYVFHITIGKKVTIYYGLEIRSPWNVSIEDGSIIGDHAILDARNGICIGKNVNMSTGAWLWTLQHNVNSVYFSNYGQAKGIKVGDRAWISSRTCILPGCSVAEGAVVAAGAVVVRPCDESFAIYGGVPAKKIGNRNQGLEYEFDGKHRLFL